MSILRNSSEEVADLFAPASTPSPLEADSLVTTTVAPSQFVLRGLQLLPIGETKGENENRMQQANTFIDILNFSDDVKEVLRAAKPNKIQMKLNNMIRMSVMSCLKPRRNYPKKNKK